MSNDNNTSKFVMHVLKLTGEWDICGSLWWRTDGEYAPVTFFINCNDVFYWGCADAEAITPENIELLEKSMKDSSGAYQYGELYGTMLWCARVRKQRPQGAAYPSERELWTLFDECGPEREIGLGNPCRPGEYSYDK